MKVFILLLLSILGILFLKIEYLLVAILLAILVFFLIKKFKFYKSKSFLVSCCLLFTFFLIISNLKLETFQSNGTFAGIVINKKNNYAICFDGVEKIYIYDSKNEFELFDIVKLQGSISNLNIKPPLESSFDFKKYLNSSGVNRQMYYNSYTHIYKSIIKSSTYKYMILSIFNNENAKSFVKLIIFHEYDRNDPLLVNINRSNLIGVFTQSGIYFSFLINRINYVLENKFPKRWLKIIVLIFIIPFLLINLTSLSIWRILIGYIVTIAFENVGLKKDYFLKVGLVYLILLLVDYHNLFSYSFFIPFIISLFLFIFRELLRSRIKIFKRIKTNLFLFIIFIPFYLRFNNSINLLTIIFNSVLIDIIKINYVLLFPSMFLLKIPLIEYILEGEYIFLSHLRIDFLMVNAPEMGINLMCLYYIALAFVAYLKETNIKFVYKKVLALVSSSLVIYFLPINNYIHDRVSFINVGQGDATLIQYRSRNYLIDTGGNLKYDIATECLIPYLRKNRIYYLDAVFITHYDLDHCYALSSLQNNFRVKDVFDYNNINSYKGLLNIYNLNNNFNINVDENSKSLVLAFEVGDKKFLIMGDAPKSVEFKILENDPILKVDVLKVGHHGSNTSSSIEFLSTLKPKEAVISCGYKNIYNHPSKETLDSLKKCNIKVRRTDLEGTISYVFSP